MVSFAGSMRPVRSTIVVFLLAFVLLLAAMNMTIGVYDEGVILAGAFNVMTGAVPHRDFYANYGPAQFYLIAGLFKAFGPSLLVERLFDAAIRAGIVAVIFRILADRCRFAAALAAAGFCLLWLILARSYGYPVFPVLLLSFVGTGLLLPSKTGAPGWRHLMLAGACTGLIALFRYDVGFFVLLAHMLALAIQAVLDERAFGRAIRSLLRQAVPYGIGTALIFVPAAAAFISAGGLPGFLHDLFEYSLSSYARTRALPFPGPATILAGPAGLAKAPIYIPFLAILVAAGWWTWSSRSVDRGANEMLPRADRAFLLLFVVLVGALTLKGLVRVSVIHMLIAIIPAIVLLTFVADRAGRIPRFARPVRYLFGLAGCGIAVGLAGLVAWNVRTSPAGSLAGLAVPGSAIASATLPNLALARLPTEAACATELVASQSEADERIFVGTMRHDKLIMNRVEFYFATNRHPGTHWYHFDPGLQTREDIQQAIIGDLQANRVRWLIRDSSMDDIREPNESALSSGVTLLDRYLAAVYRPVAQFGTVSVWLDKREAAPTPEALRCAA